jgi:hypothetical protein
LNLTQYVYLMHPFGGELVNLDRAREWCAFLSAHFAMLASAPWIPLCKHWPNNGLSLAHGIELDKLAIRRADSCIAVGGKFSQGMQVERGYAEDIGKLVYDATRFRTPNELLADEDAMLSIANVYGLGPLR